MPLSAPLRKWAMMLTVLSKTVRKISYGVGVEKTFLLHSPLIDKINVVRRGKVRRAHLGYIRGLSSKQSRIKEKR